MARVRPVWQHRLLGLPLVVLSLASAILWTSPLSAQTFDGGERPVIPASSRPAKAELQACSFREPVCVHTAGKVDRHAVLPVLAALERAVAGLRALGIEPPRDGGGGGTQAFDLYLVEGPALGPAAWAEARLFGRGLDSVNAFGVAPVDALGGCARDAELARVVAQGALLRLDAAIDEGVLAMHSSYLASLIAPCTPVEAAAIDRFQRAPESALTEGRRHRFDGGMLLSGYLDQMHGKDQPGGVMTGLVALAAQVTPPTATHWSNEPDVLDLLRRFLPTRDLTLGDVLLDFSVTRAFVGSRSDGQHLADTERYGDLGRVRFEWSVPYASLPRRLAPKNAIQPTGATFVWVDTSKVPADHGLLAAMRWETSYVYQWSIVRVDDHGRELGRITSGGVYGSDSVQLTVESLHDAAALVIVGTSLGYDDRSKPFDPESGPPQEVGYEISLYPLKPGESLGGGSSPRLR